MHIIHLHIGDFQDATKRYEPEAVGIYILLLFEYYKTEKPLPADMEELEFLCGVRTKSERASLRFVLKRCFVLSDDGQAYAHKRCDREIENYRANCIQNRYAILCRHWEKVNPGTQRPSYEEFAADVSRYYDDSTKRIRVLTARKPAESPPNQVGNAAALRTGYPPVTSNQEPVTSNQEITPVVPKGTTSSVDSNLLPTPSLGDTPPAKTKKKKEGRQRVDVESIEFDGISVALADRLREWMRYKAARGEHYTPIGFQSLVSRALKLPTSVIEEAIDLAMAQEWKGFLQPDVIDRLLRKKEKGGASEQMMEVTAKSAEPRGWREAFEREFGVLPSQSWAMLHPTTQTTITKRLDEEAMSA